MIWRCSWSLWKSISTFQSCRGWDRSRLRIKMCSWLSCRSTLICLTLQWKKIQSTDLLKTFKTLVFSLLEQTTASSKSQWLANDQEECQLQFPKRLLITLSEKTACQETKSLTNSFNLRRQLEKKSNPFHKFKNKNLKRDRLKCRLSHQLKMQTVLS